MAILSLCSKKPVHAKKGTSIQAAVEIMKRENVGSLMVTEGTGLRKPIGFVTDRDIALKAFSNGIDANSPIERIMSKKLISTRSDSGIAEVIDKMKRTGIRRIVVKNPGEEACGVVSLDDLVQLLAEEMNGIGMLIRSQAMEKRKLRSGSKKIDFYP